MGRRLRLLIVDDVRAIRSYLRQCAAELDAEVAGEAANGIDAVQKFRELKPDVILLDINMPLLEGTEALQQILSIDPRACVVMLTSQNTTSVVQECINRGAAHYLLKDNPKLELLRELKEVFRQRSAAFATSEPHGLRP